MRDLSDSITLLKTSDRAAICHICGVSSHSMPICHFVNFAKFCVKNGQFISAKSFYLEGPSVNIENIPSSVTFLENNPKLLDRLLED